MKALSIRQPWAWLIVNGFKDIENRTWATKMRGDILIHASKNLTTLDYKRLAYEVKNHHYIEIPTFAEMQKMCGGIVGQAKIIDCVTEHASPWKDDGSYGFVLRDARPLPFYPLKGMLGFLKCPST